MTTKRTRSVKFFLGLMVALFMVIVPLTGRAAASDEEAKELKVGSSEKVTLGPSDNEVFYFTADKDQAIEIFAKGDQDYLDLNLYDKDRIAIDGTYTADGKTSFSKYMAVKAGETYYIDFVNYQDKTVETEIKILDSDFGLLINNEFEGKEGETITIKPYVFTTHCKTDELSFNWVDGDGNALSSDAELKYKIGDKNEGVSCYISDTYDNHSFSVWIRVDNGLEIKEESFVLKCGSDLELSPEIKAYSKEGMTYQWYEGFCENQIDGATSPVLKLKNCTKAADYTLEVNDKYGNGAVGSFHIGIKNDTTITDNSPVIVKQGSDAVLKVNVKMEDSSVIKYRWEDPDTGEILGTTDTLTLKNLTKSRSITCVVTDKYGNEEFTWVSAWVDNGLEVSSDQLEYYINKGDSAEFKIKVKADDMTGIKYKWYSDEYRENSDEFDLDSFKEYDNNSDTLKIENIQKPMAVFCDVTDKYGSEIGLVFEVSFDKDPNQGTKDFVARIYKYVLDREPEAEGANFWFKELYNFTRSGAEVAQGFIFSDEFIARKTTDKAFVDILYKTFFGRDADEAGRNYWLEQLSTGAMDRQAVANGFIFSKEWANTCASYGIRSGGDVKPDVEIEPTDLTYAFVERMYTTAMDRESDKEGKEYWAKQLSNFAITGEQVGASFFLSEEMESFKLDDKTFLDRLYKTFMDREADSDGAAYWLGVMASGTSRADVVYGFTRSPEFTGKCVDARILPY